MADQDEQSEVTRMIDVRHALMASSSRVQVAQLAKQGKKTISLLSKERMADLIDRALQSLVDRYRAAAGPAPAPSKDPTVRELVQQYHATEQARTDLEVSRQVIHDELDVLRKQIAQEKALAEGRLEAEVDRAQLLGSPEFNRHIQTIIARVFENRRTALAPTAPPEALKELASLQPPIEDLVLRVVKEEREKHRVRTGSGSKEISMLEKRIEKLYSQLAALENALKMISSSKLTSNQQLQNALRQLGLLNEDKYFEKKKEMLKVVLDVNKVIRKDAKDLEAKGITLSSPKGREEGVRLSQTG
jgi:chromosome segregation ATPase